MKKSYKKNNVEVEYLEVAAVPINIGNTDIKGCNVEAMEIDAYVKVNAKLDKDLEAVRNIIHIITAKLELYDAPGFEDQYKRLVDDMLLGNMNGAWVEQVKKPIDFINMLNSLGKPIHEVTGKNEQVYQFLLPQQYTAYSPWIHASKLMKRVWEVTKTGSFRDVVRKTYGNWYPLVDGGFTCLASFLIKPMSTNVVTFIINKEQASLTWFAGDEPTFSKLGTADWIELKGK